MRALKVSETALLITKSATNLVQDRKVLNRLCVRVDNLTESPYLMSLNRFFWYESPATWVGFLEELADR